MRHRIGCRPQRAGLVLLLLMLTVASPSRAASARDAADAVPAGWQRQHFGSENGLTLPVRDIAQTPDGLVWLAALDGVYRFDGLRFTRVAPSSRKPVQSISPRQLLAGANGDVWVGHDWGGLSLIRGGRHFVVAQPAMGTVFSMVHGADGSSWAFGNSTASGGRLAVLRGRRWVVVATLPATPPTAPPVVDRDGRLWLIRADALWVLSPGRGLRMVKGSIPASSFLSLMPNGAAALVTDGRLRPLLTASSGMLLDSPPLPVRISAGSLSDILYENDNVLWQLTRAGSLERYELSAPVLGQRPGRVSRRERFAIASIEQGTPPRLLLDQEGSVWIATSTGLDRYRRTAFAAVPAPPEHGVSHLADPLVLTDGRGVVWLRRGRELYEVAPDGTLRRHEAPAGPTETPCPSRGGGVWLHDGRGRAILVGRASPRSIVLGSTRDLKKSQYFWCAEDGTGNFWFSQGRGLKVIRRNGAQEVPLGSESARYPSTLAVDANGRVLAYMARGSLWRFDGTRPQMLWNAKDMTLGYVQFLYQGPSYLLLGGDHGLVRFDGTRFQMLSSERIPSLSFVAGAVQTPHGDTWLQTAKGVVRLRTADLDRAFADARFQPAARVYTEADGLPGSTPDINTSSMAVDRAGRVWTATNGGFAWFDPRSFAINRRPPSIIISSLRTNGRVFPADRRLVLPQASSRIEIEFMAVSFVDPTHVQIMYRLSGVDTAWIRGGRERSAVYANLAPGTYRFQVIAANSDGAWNRTGATMEIVIPARFYQTQWFTVLCVMLAVASIWGIYLARLSALSKRLRAQAAERADERERIARDLHDTLLQSVQGLSLMFQSVARRMPTTDPNRTVMENTLAKTDEVIDEGKARVFQLRAPEQSGDLPDLIRGLIQRAPFATGTETRVEISGEPRMLTEEAARESSSIVSEALFNAARHSGAGSVVVEVVYGRRSLDVAVIDDGVGVFSNREDRNGRPGFGLIGMRERAERIGGALTIEEGEGGGTVVQLRLSGRRVFANATNQPFRSRLWKIARSARY